MKLNQQVSIFMLACLAILTIGCENIFPEEPEEHELLDGPLEGLNHQEASQFIRGDEIFNDVVFTAETGLGPIFVSTSCGSCHPGDGKGHPINALTRFGQSDSTGNKYLDQGGRQLQNRALPGYKPEILPEGAPFSLFIAPIVTGLGFLDLVSDEEILAMAKENSNREDGVRGRPNWIDIPSYVKPRINALTNAEGKRIGRFGIKANIYDLLQQTVDALNEDIGIASIFDPKDQWSGKEIEPEIATKDVRDLVFYLQTLKAPIQRDEDKAEIQGGKVLFQDIGCESCHRATLTTGPSPVSQLDRVEFHPYTDLLVHDMGPGLDDGFTEGSVKSSEWRTTPLWGLGLAKDSQGGQYYLLHDGRARSIEEAILLHGGEANQSRSQFSELPANEKQKLISFLESL